VGPYRSYLARGLQHVASIPTSSHPSSSLYTTANTTNQSAPIRGGRDALSHEDLEDLCHNPYRNGAQNKIMRAMHMTDPGFKRLSREIQGLLPAKTELDIAEDNSYMTTTNERGENNKMELWMLYRTLDPQPELARVCFYSRVEALFPQFGPAQRTVYGQSIRSGEGQRINTIDDRTFQQPPGTPDAIPPEIPYSNADQRIRLLAWAIHNEMQKMKSTPALRTAETAQHFDGKTLNIPRKRRDGIPSSPRKVKVAKISRPTPERRLLKLCVSEDDKMRWHTTKTTLQQSLHHPQDWDIHVGESAFPWNRLSFDELRADVFLMLNAKSSAEQAAVLMDGWLQVELHETETGAVSQWRIQDDLTFGRAIVLHVNVTYSSDLSRMTIV
ncbi:hypothetical protein LTR53_004396, partial [Teratosphaeriaceae sp. CCFEE 6253]